MRLKDFAYHLPKNLIAQNPIRPRDQSRLLILDKKSGQIRHQRFYEIVNYLKAGDVLVLNNTKVMPARLIGWRAETGGRVEVFLLKKSPPPPFVKGGNTWQCLARGKKRKENLRINFSNGLQAEIIKNKHDGASASLSAGRNKIFKAYRAAIRKKYRFYSYGDAMLIV